MMQFVTAWIDAAGQVQGCTVGDMPTHDAHGIEGLFKVNVGAVVAREQHMRQLSRLLWPCIEVAGSAPQFTATLNESARAYVLSIFHGPSIEADIKAAPTLNPAVAHWLARKLPPAHDWGDHIDRTAAANPRHAPTVDALLTRRYVRDPAASGIAALEARVAKKES